MSESICQRVFQDTCQDTLQLATSFAARNLSQVYADYRFWFNLLAAFMVVHAIVGVIAIEWCFSRIQRMRNIDEQRDSKFPAFRRVDASKWSRLKFYPGCLLGMPLRLLILNIMGLVLLIQANILTIGHDFKKGPLHKGWRKTLISFLYRNTAKVWILLAGLVTEYEEVDFDYSEYLGPDYKKKYDHSIKTSTIVSNHVSWHDTMNITQYIECALTLNQDFKKVPMMGGLAAVNDGIFLPRGGSEEQREKAIKIIEERQNQIEQTKKYHPLLIFAEGGTTNGSSLTKFKKGAFTSLKRVTPIVMIYDLGSSVSVAYDIIEVLPLSILNLSWGFMKCKIIRLPDIYPTDFMFNRKEAQGLEKWEVYAEVVREVMSKASGLPKSDNTFQEKKQYEGYMQMNPKYTSPYLPESATRRQPSQSMKLSECSSSPTKIITKQLSCDNSEMSTESEK